MFFAFGFIWLLPWGFLFAQESAQNRFSSIYTGSVRAPDGNPIAGSALTLQAGSQSVQGVTAVDGTFHLTFAASSASLTVDAQGFAPWQQSVHASQPLEITLQIAASAQHVVVTASRTSLPIKESPTLVQVLSQQALQQSGVIAFGDQLRQVTGLQFYRRSSNLVANPTSEGISLRGLGSTAASRTLVLADGIPISDPFGGWVYWEQVPSLAVQSVEVVSGGGSDLYGSSAIGGVINVIERSPSAFSYLADAGYGQENTPHAALFGTAVHGPWSGMAATDYLRTDGYIEIPPNLRGPVDVSANVHYQNGEIFLRRTLADNAAVFLRGNLLNEARGNGTPLQTNATRLWRYTAGADWSPANLGIFALRTYGSQEHFRQSFSSVPANRASENLTRFQQTAAQQLGASLQWTKALPSNLTLVAGSDVNDVRASDDELPISHGNPNGLSDTSARQRDVGEYAEALWKRHSWLFSGAVREDDFLNLDILQYMQTGKGPIVPTTFPNRSEQILSVKAGVVRNLNRHVTLKASGYRAFRSPTMNELYRQFQVGQEITLANANLQSERATGWEIGSDLSLPRWNSWVRASYFWTEVNRPVTSITIATTPTSILQQRENLGQIQSKGVAFTYNTQPLQWLGVTGGYQYADATVTRFDQQPSLVGHWIPQVAHNMATMQVSASSQKIGTARLLGTLSGRQYDDAANAYLLHAYFQLDAYASHAIGSRVEVYGAVNNLFDRTIEVGRTPILTVGTPRLASFGLRIHSADAATR